MMRKQALIASVLLGTSLVSFAALADSAASTTANESETEAATPATTPKTDGAEPTATPAGTDSEVLSKTNWLNTIVPMLPSLICKGFLGDPDLKARLDKIKMDYDQCVRVIPESVSKCQNQLSGSIPDKITNEDAATWGKTLGECIGKDFAMKYLVPK